MHSTRRNDESGDVAPGTERIRTGVRALHRRTEEAHEPELASGMHPLPVRLLRRSVKNPSSCNTKSAPHHGVSHSTVCGIMDRLVLTRVVGTPPFVGRVPTSGRAPASYASGTVAGPNASPASCAMW